MQVSCNKCGSAYEIDVPGRYQCSQCGNEFDAPALPVAQPVAMPSASPDAFEWSGNPSRLGYFFTYVFLFAMVIVLAGVGLFSLLGVETIDATAKIAILIFSGFVLFLVAMVFAITELSRTTTKYKITPTEVTMVCGIFSRTKLVIRIADIRDIVTTQGLFERLFGLGTICLSTAGTEKITLYALRNFEQIEQKLRDAQALNR